MNKYPLSKAILISASSSIGAALAEVLASKGSGVSFYGIHKIQYHTPQSDRLKTR